MAEKISREDEYVIWQCTVCEHNHYFHKNDYRQDGLSCEECGGAVNIAGYTNQKPSPLHNPKSVGTLTVDIDVQDALTGLKAVQREARKTIQVLKELEEQQEKIDPELFKMHYLCEWTADEELPTKPEISE